MFFHKTFVRSQPTEGGPSKQHGQRLQLIAVKIMEGRKKTDNPQTEKSQKESNHLKQSQSNPTIIDVKGGRGGRRERERENTAAAAILKLGTLQVRKII